MNEVQHEQMCEDAAYGEWLIETIANNMGSKLDPASINRAVYKGTSCGAWVKFDEKGIIVGTIVECGDAEYSERIELTDDADELCKRFWAALNNCEAFAEEEWAEAEAEDMPDWMRPVDQYQEAMDHELNAEYDRWEGWGDPDPNDGWANEPADSIQGPPPPPPARMTQAEIEEENKRVPF